MYQPYYKSKHPFAPDTLSFAARSQIVPITEIAWETMSTAVNDAMNAWTQELEQASSPLSEEDVIAQIDAIDHLDAKALQAKIAAQPGTAEAEDAQAILCANADEKQLGLLKLSFRTPNRHYEIDCVKNKFSFSHGAYTSENITASNIDSSAVTIPGHGVTWTFYFMNIRETYDPELLMAKVHLIYLCS